MHDPVADVTPALLYASLQHSEERPPWEAITAVVVTLTNTGSLHPRAMQRWQQQYLQHHVLLPDSARPANEAISSDYYAFFLTPDSHTVVALGVLPHCVVAHGPSLPEQLGVSGLMYQLASSALLPMENPTSYHVPDLTATDWEEPDLVPVHIPLKPAMDVDTSPFKMPEYLSETPAHLLYRPIYEGLDMTPSCPLYLTKPLAQECTLEDMEEGIRARIIVLYELNRYITLAGKEKHNYPLVVDRSLWYQAIYDVLNTFLSLRTATDRWRDQISYMALQIISLQSPDWTDWVHRGEIELLRWRLMFQFPHETMDLKEVFPLQWTEANQHFRTYLRDKYGNDDEDAWCWVPWEQVCRLVGARAVVLWQGRALVTYAALACTILDHTLREWSITQDHLQKVVHWIPARDYFTRSDPKWDLFWHIALSTRRALEKHDGYAGWRGQRRRVLLPKEEMMQRQGPGAAQLVPDLEDLGTRKVLPPCMQAMYTQLTRHKRHLKFDQRSAYARFLLAEGYLPDTIANHWRPAFAVSDPQGPRVFQGHVTDLHRLLAGGRMAPSKCVYFQQHGLCPFSEEKGKSCAAAWQVQVGTSDPFPRTQGVVAHPNTFLRMALSRLVRK